jgi:ubiquinone/menaquinone biosynthesis C-methylase UbiE
MFGVPFEAKAVEQRKLLEEAGVRPLPDGSAIDLGCGSGFQSVALNDLGYQVLALDSNEKLLGDLIEIGESVGVRRAEWPPRRGLACPPAARKSSRDIARSMSRSSG